MKSIKPGRGNSAFGGVMSIFMGIFGVIWTISALSMGAPWFFALFGLVFIGIAIARAVYGFHNAFSKNRFSSFDVTEHGEEPDPFQTRFYEETSAEAPRSASGGGGYCPYCGKAVEEEYLYCNGCGRKLPS